MSRMLLSSFVLVLAAPAWADDLDRILERDKIDAKKLFTDVEYAIKDSHAAAKDRPGAAALTLERAMDSVRAARFLSDADKSSLLRRLQTRLNEVNESLRVSRLAAEERAMREGVELLRKMKEAELAKKGSGVTEIAKSYVAPIADRLAAADKLKKTREAGFLGVMTSIGEAAVPIAGDIEYGKHWEWVLKNRKPGGGNKLDPKEVALLKTLNSTLSVNFDKEKFRDVINFLQEKTKLPIIIDKGSLDDALVDYDDPVDLKIERVTVRTILKKVLGDLRLTYIIRDGTIHVMTPAKAREIMVVRLYPIQDFLGTADPRAAFFDPATQFMINNLIKSIQTAVEPGIWDVNGGPASITFSASTMSFIIRAPAELHYMMGSGSLR